MFVTFQLIIT